MYIGHREVKSLGTSFHRFPTRDAKVCNMWLQFCNLQHLMNLKREELRKRFLCSRHFREKDFLNITSNKLNRNAVPSIVYPEVSRAVMVPGTSAEAGLILPSTEVLAEARLNLPTTTEPAEAEPILPGTEVVAEATPNLSSFTEAAGAGPVLPGTEVLAAARPNMPSTTEPAGVGPVMPGTEVLAEAGMSGKKVPAHSMPVSAAELAAEKVSFSGAIEVGKNVSDSV